MNIFVKIFLHIKDLFFPASCVLCNCALIYSGEMKYGLCEKCRDSVVNIHEDSICKVCGKPLISENEICIPCRVYSGQCKEEGQEEKKHSYERLWTLFPYTGRYRKILTSYKFKKNLILSEIFTKKITEVINENPEIENAIIVPVPPRPGKIKENGWDQIDYLAKRLKKSCIKNSVRFLLKRKKSKIQKYLNRKERLENLKDRIYVSKTALKFLAGRAGDDSHLQTVLIIDDVITTGSTMEVCAKALKEAGAQKVFGLCLFYD